METRPLVPQGEVAKRYFDNTTISSYKNCPREYYLRHVRGWRRVGIGLPLVFGLSWHAAMDVVWQGYGKDSNENLVLGASAAFDMMWEEQGMKPASELGLEDIERLGQRTPMIAREMLIAYIAAREHILMNSELIACEQPFAVPLPLDPTQPGSTWYAGRLDKVVDYNGVRRVIEHKSTTEYKIDGGFKTNYLQGWYLDSQIMGYLYGGALFFEGLKEVWVDASLVHKKARNFKFIPVDHGFSMLESWIYDTMEWVRRIYNDERAIASQGRLTHGVFPKQSGSCIGKYGPCQFLEICRNIPDPSELDEAPDGFIEERWSPFDVLKLNQLVQGEKDA